MAGKTRRGFGRIEKRASGKYRASFTGPDGILYRAPKTFTAKQDAEGWLSAENRLIERATARDPWSSPVQRRAAADAEEIAGITLDQLFDAYLAAGDLKPRTLDLYRYQWDRLISPALGSREVVALTPTAVADWRSTLPPAPRQREQAADLLRAVLGLAVEQRTIDYNPAARSRRKAKGKVARTRRREVPRLTREEVATMAEAMPLERRFALLLSAYTGVRFSELVALRRGSLTLTRDDAGELQRARVHVSSAVTRAKGEDGRRRSVEGSPKSGAGIRVITVPSAYLPDLEDHLERYSQPGDDGLVFPGTNGEFLTPTALYGEKPGDIKHGIRDGKQRIHPSKGRGYYLARVVAGRPDANWHQLRAFAVSEAVDAGATPADLLRRYGHTDLRTSGLYQRAAQGAEDALADRMGE